MEALAKITKGLDDLDNKHDIVKADKPVDLFVEFIFYKLNFIKALMERKIRLWTDCDTTIQFLVSQVNDESKAWNKFAIRATYLRVRMLADSMEFKIPRTRM